MLNPSTADADRDDPTIRKCCGFTRRWICGGIRVVNLYALRATDPKDLARAPGSAAIGPDNDAAIVDALAGARLDGALCVVAWGAHPGPQKSEREEFVRNAATRCGVQLQCLGRTASGAPRHPLMLPYSTGLKVWS